MSCVNMRARVCVCACACKSVWLRTRMPMYVCVPVSWSTP